MKYDYDDWFIVSLIIVSILWYIWILIAKQSLLWLFFIIVCFIGFQYWINKWEEKTTVVKTKNEIENDKKNNKEIERITKIFQENAYELNTSMKTKFYTLKSLWISKKRLDYQPKIIKIWPKSIWYYIWSHKYKMNIKDFIKKYILW